MGTEVSVRKTRQTCWNCKGRGWVDAFDAAGRYLGKETCTVCGGEGGRPLIACEQLQRRCYMMELDPRYCQIIIDRWEHYTGQNTDKIDQ